MSQPDERFESLSAWVREALGLPVTRLEPASADASFRRYFRLWLPDGSTRVVMDAPPGQEDLGPYLAVGRMLEQCAVHVPHVLASERRLGFVLMEDLGSEHYLARLGTPAMVDALYADALDALARVQLRGAGLASALPPYDRATLEREMALMPEWFCQRHLGLELRRESEALLAQTFDWLVRMALAQPVVFVHRDYHSRNLMVCPGGNPGVVDFQDALAGPVGYDLVSLLKDCYIAWPRARVEAWVLGYRARLLQAGAPHLAGADAAEFLRWFDLIGVQRHVKVLGIFARLWYRDGKSGYLADLPRTLDYVCDAASRYPELSRFGHWLGRIVAPALELANARVRGGAPA